MARAPIDGGLRGLCKDNIRLGHWTPIETSEVQGGVPDINWCYRHREVWIECKQTHAFALATRALQIGWCETRMRHGGSVFYMIRRWKTTKNEDQVWLVDGRGAKWLHLNGLRNIELSGARYWMWSGGPAKWGWDQIASILQVRRDADGGIPDNLYRDMGELRA